MITHEDFVKRVLAHAGERSPGGTTQAALMSSAFVVLRQELAEEAARLDRAIARIGALEAAAAGGDQDEPPTNPNRRITRELVSR